MSAVLGIIAAHKGALQLTSQPGQGTTFRVFFPVGSGDTPGGEAEKQTAATVPWKGSGTILLAEDEPSLLLSVGYMLKKLGFTVIEAANGREALEMYQENAAIITLVLTDMGMPVMDGYGLLRELKKRDARLPVIISSGFGDSEILSRIAPEDIAGLVCKPYDYDQLRDALKRVVEKVRPSGSVRTIPH